MVVNFDTMPWEPILNAGSTSHSQHGWSVNRSVSAWALFSSMSSFRDSISSSARASSCAHLSRVYSLSNSRIRWIWRRTEGIVNVTHTRIAMNMTTPCVGLNSLVYGSRSFDSNPIKSKSRGTPPLHWNFNLEERFSKDSAFFVIIISYLWRRVKSIAY